MEFSIELRDPTLRFNALHFVGFQTDANGARVWRGESLHGHDFRVEARVTAPLGGDGCVVDFIAARAALASVLAGMSGRVLVARGAQCARYRDCGAELEIEIATGAEPPETWRVPKSSVRYLDGANASTELIAAEILREWLRELSNDAISRVELRLEEAPGDFAVAVFEKS